jgi:hypothetical protein
MPTLDQLAPAIAVSDTDEMLISQNGICVKATRAQVIAGLQTELSVPSGSLTGRSSAGTGGPESITVGANLTLAGVSFLQVPRRMWSPHYRRAWSPR